MQFGGDESARYWGALNDLRRLREDIYGRCVPLDDDQHGDSALLPGVLFLGLGAAGAYDHPDLNPAVRPDLRHLRRHTPTHFAPTIDRLSASPLEDDLIDKDNPTQPPPTNIRHVIPQEADTVGIALCRQSGVTDRQRAAPNLWNQVHRRQTCTDQPQRGALNPRPPTDHSLQD
jgi:hypothetical protein